MKKINKSDVFLIILLGVASVFGIFLFNQYDVLLKNQEEFGVELIEVLWTFTWPSLLTVVIVCGVLFILARFAKTAFKIVVSILLGFLLASYIQVLFLNNTYNNSQAFTHSTTAVWEQILNAVIWVVLLPLPLLLMFLDKFKKIKMKDFFIKFALFSSGVILVMQSIGVMTTAAQAKAPIKDIAYYFSIDDQLKLSNNENIVVFILDRLGTEYTDGVFDKYPDAKDTFEGFTYYKNNLSEYYQTFPSLISMFTGVHYDKTESRQVFSERAWKEPVLFDELEEHGYTTNVIMSSFATFGYDISLIENVGIDNLKYFDTTTREVNEKLAFETMNKFAWQRILPYVFKPFVETGYPDVLNEIVKSYDKSEPPDDMYPRNVSKSADEFFGEKLDDLGVSASNEQKTFSFVHLYAAHAGGKEVSSVVDPVYGTFNMLYEYFTEMKDAGVYEKSTIIVMADHGYYDFNATLFIKPKEASDGDLVTDTETKLSHINFLPTIMELIGSDSKSEIPSYFDIIGGETQERYIYRTHWNGSQDCRFDEKVKVD